MRRERKRKRKPPVDNLGRKRVDVGQGGAGPPTVHYLTKASPFHRGLLGLALERIAGFPSRYPSTDSNGQILARWVDDDFVKGKPSTVVFVAEQDGELVAHLFGAVMKNDFAGGTLYLHIFQVELDKNHGMSRDLERAIFEQVLEWGRSRNAGYVTLECDDPGLVKRYQEEFGFEPRRIVMRRAL